MPAKSQQQQKFMGLVHAYKKGEVPASKVSKAVKDAAKSMSNKSVKKYAKTKHDELPKKVTEKKERDYKAEYKKFQSSTKAKKYRAELNKYNRQKGTYGNGDGKDASHKGGKIVGFEAQSKNRGRKEKSRLKKESAFSVKIDTFQNAMKSLDKLSDILKKGGEKKKSMMVSKLIKQLQQAFFRKEIMEHNIKEDITKLEMLAMNLLRDINRRAGVKNYDTKTRRSVEKVIRYLQTRMPTTPMNKIAKIAWAYDSYRQKQPKAFIPDIDSVKHMEKTLKRLGMRMKETVYHFKGFTNKQMDELDAMLYRAGVRGTPDFNKRTYTVDKEIPKLDKIMKRSGGKKINEYEYKVGDMVKDVNPTCPHNGAIGKVKSVNPKSVVFIVKNKGDNYEPGDVLDKTHDQMEKVNESILKEASSLSGTVNPHDLSDEGLHDYFKTFSDYRRVSPKHAELLGWSVIGDILGKGAKDLTSNDPSFQTLAKAGETNYMIDTPTFGPTINQQPGQTDHNVNNPFPEYQQYMRKIAKKLGMNIIKFFGEDKKVIVKEGSQKDMNNLALYIIDLNNMLSNAKVLAKKDPKAKMYIKLLQKDIKDAKQKLAKIKKPIRLKSKSGMGKISHLGMENVNKITESLYKELLR